MNAADCSPVGRGTREAAARPRVRKILSEGGPGRRPSRSLRPRHGVPTMPSQRRPSPARAVSRPRGPRRAADPPDRRPDARRRPGAAPRSRPLRSDGPERSRAPRADAGEIDHESITTVRGAGTRPRRERRRAIVNCPRPPPAFRSPGRRKVAPSAGAVPVEGRITQTPDLDISGLLTPWSLRADAISGIPVSALRACDSLDTSCAHTSMYHPLS